MTAVVAPTRTTVVPNALARHRDVLERALARLAAAGPTGEPGDFSPGTALPPPSAALDRCWAASELAVTDLGEYRGRRLTLLDLMRNPGTRTTKTMASLVIVARAVAHVQRTGEPVMIVTPSSANKATALRDAVLRAVQSGLVTPDQLRIAVVVPEAATDKLWASALSADPDLRRRNPVVVARVAERAGVKALAREVVTRLGDEVHRGTGVRLWYTMDIANYKVADALRAVVERDALPEPVGRGRLHAHAVSSAFGLLGHHLGHQLLAEDGDVRPDPRYLLVQHLDTPDMVLSLHFGSTSRANLPAYAYDDATGLYHQSADPRFPATTADPEEVLETTFYTRQPATSAAMDPLIRSAGGGGIVVSLHECLSRYHEVRRLVAGAEVVLPADPRRLREWSLVMAVTGVLNAVDRGLVDEGDDVVVHGSGSYADDQYEPLAAAHTARADDADAVGRVVAAAASAGRPAR